VCSVGQLEESCNKWGGLVSWRRVYLFARHEQCEVWTSELSAWRDPSATAPFHTTLD